MYYIKKTKKQIQLFKKRGSRVAQLVEARRTQDPKTRGSNPARNRRFFGEFFQSSSSSAFLHRRGSVYDRF